MSDFKLEQEKKLLAAKMLLDTFEIPKRPVTMSAHQYKKKFGTNQGYASYKRQVKEERKQWDSLYKTQQKHVKMKNKFLAEISLSDEALEQAKHEALETGLTIPDILSAWLEKGRKL